MLILEGGHDDEVPRVAFFSANRVHVPPAHVQITECIPVNGTPAGPLGKMLVNQLTVLPFLVAGLDGRWCQLQSRPDGHLRLLLALEISADLAVETKEGAFKVVTDCRVQGGVVFTYCYFICHACYFPVSCLW